MKYALKFRKDVALRQADAEPALATSPVEIAAKNGVEKAIGIALVLAYALSDKLADAAGQTLVYTGTQNTVTEATAVAGGAVLLGIIATGIGVATRQALIMKGGGGVVVGGGVALGAIQIRDYIFGGNAGGAVIDAITNGLI
jgi:TrbC/VIRB2 family pilin